MERCPECGVEPDAERTVRIRVAPRPGTKDRYIVTDADTGKDISGFVPAATAFDGALPSERVRGHMYSSDPAHVIPGVGEICRFKAIYEVV
jgi:hypothetical protein